MVIVATSISLEAPKEGLLISLKKQARSKHQNQYFLFATPMRKPQEAQFEVATKREWFRFLHAQSKEFTEFGIEIFSTIWSDRDYVV